MEALRQLKYHFNSELELRHIETGEPFEFVDQVHYEELADAVADYIQEIMVKDYDMVKVELPFQEHLCDTLEDQEEESDASIRCPIFVSSNHKEANIVLILLCGTGRVMSGQWARRLCINDSLKTGSVLPFLDWARKHSFGVIVLNPNKTFVETAEGCYRIPFNESSEAHVNYAWQALFKSLPAKHFALVAHSYGGVSTCNLLEHHGEEVLERLRCIAFTDSAHSRQSVEMLPEESKEFLARYCINWASSTELLDTVLEMPPGKAVECSKKSGTGRTRMPRAGMGKTRGGCCSINKYFETVQDEEAVNCDISDLNALPELSEQPIKKKKQANWLRSRNSMCTVVSAGTDVHELTTMSAYPSICKFLLDRLQSAGAAIEPTVG